MIDELIYAAATLMVWSALYRDNPLFKIVQNLIIGLYLGMTITAGLDVLYTKAWIPIFVGGKLFSLLTIGIILGILMLTRLVKGVEWAARYPIAVLTAIGGSVAVTGAIGTQILGQLQMPPLTTIDNVLMVVGVFTSITYFLFSVRTQNPIFKLSTQIGKIFLMISLGCMLGLEFMTNVSLPIGSLPHLVLGPGRYVTLVGIIILVAAIIYDSRK